MDHIFLVSVSGVVVGNRMVHSFLRSLCRVVNVLCIRWSNSVGRFYCLQSIDGRVLIISCGSLLTTLPAGLLGATVVGYMFVAREKEKDMDRSHRQETGLMRV